jgi:hypothetical protein
MKFYITRTSGEKPPHPKAVLEASGGYYIEIDSLQELLEFSNDVGEIILGAPRPYRPPGVEAWIEIYDDYRE